MKRFLIPLAALLTTLSDSAAQPRSYMVVDPLTVADSTLTFPSGLSTPLAAVEIRAAIFDDRRLMTGASASSLTVAAGDVSLNIRRHADYNDNIDDGSRLILTLYAAGRDTTFAAPRSVSTTGGVNTFLLEWLSPDILSVSVGGRSAAPIILPAVPAVAADVTVTVEGRATIQSLVAAAVGSDSREGFPRFSAAEINAAIESESDYYLAPTGYYRYLDRVSDPNFVRLGGRYRLAVIPDPENPADLLIIYLDGAEVDPDKWLSGMVKGRLKSTEFSGHYDLEWYDAHGRMIDSAVESFASFDSSSSIISIAFPVLDASLRFAREAAVRK